jgi:hypothetical protein
MTGKLPAEEPHPLALRHEGSSPRRAKKLVLPVPSVTEGSNAEPPVVSAAEPCVTRKTLTVRLERKGAPPAEKSSSDDGS